MEGNSSNISTISHNSTTDSYQPTARILNITLMSVGIATVLMNIFVISIIIMYKFMRSNANIIIGSMAITDLLAGMVTITAGSVKWTDWFSVRGLFCEIFYTIDGWSAMASLAHVLAVNADRYLAIVFPLKYKNITSTGRIMIGLLIVWIVTLVEAILYTYSNKLSQQCLLEGMSNPGLAFGVLITAVGIPFLTVLAIYVHIVIVVIKKLRFMAKSSNLDQAALARSQRKMFVIVSAILAAWIICWLPLMCILLVITGAQAAQIELDVAQFVTMFYYVEVMSYGNSLLNPILYFLTSADFRKAGLLLFRCKSNEKTETPATTDTASTRM